MISLLRAGLIFGFFAPHFGSCAHFSGAGASHFSGAAVRAAPAVHPVVVRPNPEAAAVATDVLLEAATATPVPVEIQPPPPSLMDAPPPPPVFACRSDQDCFWGERCVYDTDPSGTAAGSCLIEL
jgi:hypothetical protein